MTRLYAENLAKQYRGRRVVDDISLEVASGEVVGLLGPNGAGKTTSFYMIVGLVPADGGSVRINGKDLTDLPMHTRARLGISYLGPGALSVPPSLGRGEHPCHPREPQGTVA